MKETRDDLVRFNRIAWRHGWPSLADPNPFPTFRLFGRHKQR